MEDARGPQTGCGCYLFGEFELRPQSGELRRGGRSVPLQRQPLRVLEVLVSRAGEVVRRADLFRALWGESVHVDYDRGLNYCIRQIRRALGDHAERPVYVQTLPRYGYRFIAPVTRAPRERRTMLQNPPDSPVRRGSRPGTSGRPAAGRGTVPPVRRGILLGVTAAMLLIMTPVVAWWAGRSATERAGIPPLAFDDYLRGRHLLEQNGPGAAAQAIDALQRAVAGAPGFARAHLALAGAYARLPGDPAASAARARRELRRAIELDGTLAEAYEQIALIRLYSDWDFDGAGAALRRAVELRPDSPGIRQARASYFSMVGRHNEAIDEIGRAMALDPVSTALKADAGWFFYQARRYEEAIAISRTTLELEPDNQGALWTLLQSHRQLGQGDAALGAARRLKALLEPETEGPADLAGFWRWYLTFNEHGGPQQGGSPSISGLMYLALGERERALDLFELATERRLGCVLSLASDPQLDPLRDEPRFAALLSRIGLSG